MHRRILFWSAIVWSSALAFAEADSKFQMMLDALQFREDMSARVAGQDETPQAAITRIREHASPNGIKIGPEADFALAAGDVGQRLIAKRDPAKAELFFIEAEKALNVAIEKTPDADASRKAMLLQERARLRGNYLNKRPGARADLDEAIRLQPENELLRHKRETLPRESSAVSESES